MILSISLSSIYSYQRSVKKIFSQKLLRRTTCKKKKFWLLATILFPKLRQATSLVSTLFYTTEKIRLQGKKDSKQFSG